MLAYCSAMIGGREREERDSRVETGLGLEGSSGFGGLVGGMFNAIGRKEVLQ